MRATWSGLTGRGRATALVGALLLVAGTTWGYLLVATLGGCLLALVLLELVSVLLARPVEVERTVEPRVVVRQEPCEGRLLVRGRRRRGLVRLDVADRVGETRVPVVLPDRADAAARTTPVAYPIPTPRRGLVEVGPLQVRLTGLAAMAARSTRAGSVDEVRVLPRRVPLAGMLGGRSRAVVGGDLSAELGGTDLVGLHEYAMGDDLRRLHWATSARAGTLMVREDADPAEAHVSVILDDRAASYLGDDALFEEAVELAAALCRTTAHAGSPLRFHTTSGRGRTTVAGSAVRRPARALGTGGRGRTDRADQADLQDLEWLLAEIELTSTEGPLDLDARDLDVAVAVTGPGSDRRALALELSAAPSRVLAILDPAPLVGAHQEAGLLVLRAATSSGLAGLWDQAVHQ